MTDLEFLARVHRELTTSPQWTDIRGVLTPADDPSLSGNELRVFPATMPDAAGRVDVFRLIVEWEIRWSGTPSTSPACGPRSGRRQWNVSAMFRRPTGGCRTTSSPGRRRPVYE